MELNGVGNIDIQLQMALMDKKIDPEVAKKIKEELDTLERYMLAYASKFKQVAPVGSQHVPKWHEVRAEKEKYPNMKEFVNGIEKNSNQKEEMDR